MKTKHLFFATALVASLAACTNDDFSFDKQQNVANDGRPTVSDVKLNFVGDNAETRLAFGKNGYAWEANDTIGALLMDNVADLDDDKTWLEKYTLTKYIHTSYPFTYSTADKTWGCNTKMLEGNYFFAFPWESYDGNRQVRHSLTKQEQKGVKGNVVAEAYAKNQFFIGYSQIKAGTNAKDALTDVEMTSLLGAIQLRIVNTGTQTYHINKVVLRGTNIKSELTFDPTNAAYGTEANSQKWNVGGNTGKFNYANYTNNQEDLVDAGGDYVYNIEAGDKYNRMAALRAVVKASGDAANAQLIITGTPEERALVSTKDDPKAMAYALIMANEDADVTDLKLDIYTDEGLVSGVDLTTINTAAGNRYQVVTDSKVEKIAPDVANTIKVQIDDNSFNIPNEMEVYDNDDLLQFIEWNATVTGVRTATATLRKDVTLTKEMTDALTKNLSLTIEAAAGQVLSIAEDVAENVLENERLTIGADIKVLGTVALTKETNKFKKAITIAETGTLNINVDGVELVANIENNGTLNVGDQVTLKNMGGKITNNAKAVMNVGKLADVKAGVTNEAEATLNVNGFIIGMTNNKDAEVVMGEGANLANVTNEGVIRTAKDAVVAGTNSGEIIYVEGAKITAKSGTISYETSGKTFGKDAFKDNGVNKLILKRGETKISDDLTIANITIAEDGVVLKVADKKTLNVTNLAVEATATTDGTINADNVVVEKDATLTNNGKITAATKFENQGVVANNGTVLVPASQVDALNATNWKYNNAEENETVTPPTPAEPVSVTIAATTNGTDYTLEDLYKAVTAETGAIKIKDITISTSINAGEDSDIEKTAVVGSTPAVNYTNGELLKALANGKDVTLAANSGLAELTPSLGLAFGKLTVSSDATISGTANLVALTVNELVANADLTITETFVKVNDAKASVGFGSELISGTGDIIGTIVSANGLSWDADNKKWKGME